MIADTRYVHIDRSINMKVKGLEHPAGQALARWAAQRAPLKQIICVLVAAVVLACIHREISGISEGSLIALVAPHARDLIHRLASDLF